MLVHKTYDRVTFLKKAKIKLIIGKISPFLSPFAIKGSPTIYSLGYELQDFALSLSLTWFRLRVYLKYFNCRPLMATDSLVSLFQFPCILKFFYN